MQLALLPNREPPPEVKIAFHYRSAEKMGGDWVSYEFDERMGRLYMCVGDVTGHGIPFALVTAAAAGAVKLVVARFGNEQSQGPMGLILESMA